MNNPLPITFLSNYGHQNKFMNIYHKMIKRIAPGATVIDLTHGLPPHNVRAAALALRNTLPFVPKKTHPTVVDPNIETPQKPITLRYLNNHILTNPNNKLL